MRLIFTFIMRYAAAVLFVIGILNAVAMILIGLQTMAMMGDTLDRIGNESSYASWTVSAYARAFAPALTALVWPWLGAAALWRFDGIYLRRRPVAAQEATE